MNELDNKTKSTEETSEQDESQATGKTGLKSRKVLILVGALVLVVVASVIVVLTVPGFRGKFISSPALEEVADHEAKRPSVKAILPLDPFLVNLADEEGIRFVKTTFQLGLEEEWKESSESDIVRAAIRDSIISLLSSKTADQIMSAPGKDKLREEVRAKVNAVSPHSKVLEVYIVDFVVQL